MAARNPQVPEVLANLVDVLLDKDKEKRPSMAALEVQLEQMTAELPPPAKHRHRNRGDGGGAKWTARSSRCQDGCRHDADDNCGTTGVVDKQRRSVVWIGLGIALSLTAVGVACSVFGDAQKAGSKARGTDGGQAHSLASAVRSGCGLKVVRVSDGVVLGKTPLDQEAEQSSEPIRLRVEAAVLPQDVQIGLSASGEVQSGAATGAAETAGRSATCRRAKAQQPTKTETKRVEVPHRKKTKKRTARGLAGWASIRPLYAVHRRCTV